MAMPAPIIIIYNPNSTGEGRTNARELQKALRERKVNSQLVATEYAGHAIELAREFASQHPRGMVISSSGDGGYHEVVNGVLNSKHPSVITGVLPSGNANDHYHFVHQGDTAMRIARGTSKRIDVLKVETPDWTRYAHSYAGLGLTPHIGKKLTEERPTRIQEKWLVLKNLFKAKPVKIRTRGMARSYSNIVFSNSGRMSKILTLSNNAKIDDGHFEVTRVRGASYLKLFSHLLRATVNRIDRVNRTERFAFTALRNMCIQIDGELYTVLSGQKVVITCEKHMLRSIV